jgi:hypothetical protein
MRPLAVVSLVLPALLVAARAADDDIPPPPRSQPPVVEKGDLRLEVRSRPGYADKGEANFTKGNDRTWDVTLVLINTARRLRSVEELKAPGNRLAAAPGVVYVVWFPDGGKPQQLTASPPPVEAPKKGEKPQPRPLVVAGRGYLHDTANLRKSLDASFAKRFLKNKGRFCLTAVIPSLGLQSNTLCYNKCPAPPKPYDPLAQATPRPGAKKAPKGR